MDQPKAPSLGSDPRVQQWVLLLFAAAVFFAKLGLNGMANYDDCFYAQEAKEVLASGKWSVLSYNGLPAFNNTTLFPWLEALSYLAFGVGVFAAKFPSALLGFLTVFLVYYLGRLLWDSRTGFLAGFILATTLPFLKYGRHAMLDVPLTFFVTLSMVGLVLAIRKDQKFFWLWGIGVALAILSKSAFGFFPVIATFLFLAGTKRWREFLGFHFLGASLLFLSTTLAWALTQYAVGGAGFIKTHLGFIILGKMIGGEPEPWFVHLSYLRDFATFYWPWLPFALWGLVLLGRGEWKDKEGMLFLLLWAFLVPVVMSFAHLRYLWYLMQAFPAWALISAYGLSRALPSEGAREKLVKGTVLLGFFSAVLINLLPYSLDKDRERDIRSLAPYVKYFAGQGARLSVYRESYYGINNALLFFSDQAVPRTSLYKEPADLKAAFKDKGVVLCLVHRADWKGLGEQIPAWSPVKFGEDLILISNRKLDLSQVTTWGSSGE